MRKGEWIATYISELLQVEPTFEGLSWVVNNIAEKMYARDPNSDPIAAARLPRNQRATPDYNPSEPMTPRHRGPPALASFIASDENLVARNRVESNSPLASFEHSHRNAVLDNEVKHQAQQPVSAPAPAATEPWYREIGKKVVVSLAVDGIKWGIVAIGAIAVAWWLS